MELHRRAIIAGAGAAATALASCNGDAPLRSLGSGDSWDEVRAQFALSRELIDMSAMLLASHPRRVREAIERHRRALDHDTVGYLEANNQPLTDAARSSAAEYLGVAADDVALVDSTTMGIGLIYAGLRLQPGDEILTTEQDYFVTHEAIRLACLRTGAVQRRLSLHGDIPNLGADEIVARIRAVVTPRTRALGLTWVHSSTGLKMPARRIAEAVRDLNRGRDQQDRILFVLDGVHGFGNQDVTLDAVGCDFFASGCHKWLFGPRGTGIVAARPDAWDRFDTHIPSFIDDGVFGAWLSRRASSRSGEGARLTPGGFKAFEHVWSLPEAFALHAELGKGAVERRTHELAAQLKEGLEQMAGVTLATPRSSELSAGIVSFNVEGESPEAVVRRLRDRRIVASTAPYAKSWVRLTPSIRNSPAEIEAALAAVSRLAA